MFTKSSHMLASLVQNRPYSVINPPWTFPMAPTRITGAAPMSVTLKSLSCTNCGKLGHVSAACPLPHKTDLKTMFAEHRCCVCGLHGHLSKHCPTEGHDPSLSPKVKIPVPRAVLWANKVCMSCGQRGHIYQACPSHKTPMQGLVSIRGIKRRYAGARLQKMLPRQLQTPRFLPSVVDRLKYSDAKGSLGTVVRTTHSKTVTVLIERHTWHPWVKIQEYRYTKLVCHDESETCMCGDLVRVIPCRPKSKTKHHIVKEVVMGFNQRHEIAADKAASRISHMKNIDELAAERLRLKGEEYVQKRNEFAMKKSKMESSSSTTSTLPEGFESKEAYDRIMKETKLVMEQAVKEDVEDFAKWKESMRVQDEENHARQNVEDDEYYRWAKEVDDAIAMRKSSVEQKEQESKAQYLLNKKLERKLKRVDVDAFLVPTKKK